jgi:N-methylhydantoinase A
MRTVIIPLGAGVASAIGALAAPMTLPCARSYLTKLRQCDWTVVQRLYDDMAAEARRALAAPGTGEPVLHARAAADMRYAGQYHEIHVDLPSAETLGPHAVEHIEAHFRRRYSEAYGRALSVLPVEVHTWYLMAEHPRQMLTIAPQPRREADRQAVPKGRREAYFAAPVPGYRPCPVYDRYHLNPGTAFSGPCIIEETEATIVVPPGDWVDVDEYRNVVIHLH